jgi:hypothetical protein
MNKEQLREAVERATTSFFDHYCGTGHMAYNRELGKLLGIDENHIDTIIVGVIKGLAEAQILSGKFSYYGSPVKMMEEMAAIKLNFQPESVGGCVISTPVPNFIIDKIPENVPTLPSVLSTPGVGGFYKLEGEK